MKKFELAQALANGNITLGRLAEEDQYLLIVASTDKTCFVPYVKVKGSTFAYIDPEYDIDDYEALTAIIETANEAKTFKGIYSFKPINREAPEHSHIVVGFVKSSGAVSAIPEDIEDILAKGGYKLQKKELHTAFKKRDYSELMTDPENKRIYEEDAAQLESVGATYEALPLQVKIEYESIESGKSGGLIFAGPTGTGKSFAARVLAHRAGAPLLNVQITNGTVPDELIGSFVPVSGDKTELSEDAPAAPEVTSANALVTLVHMLSNFFKKVLKIESSKNKNFKFVEGALLKAYSQGYPIVIEEVNFGQPGVIAALNQFTDGTPRVMVYDRIYRRHPNFVVYMTMNPGYKGTEPLNISLKNRFPIVDVPALTKPEFISRMQNYSKELGYELNGDFFGKLFDFAATIEKEAASAKWHADTKFSIRNAERLCNKILYKKYSFEEFSAAIGIEYLNHLALDNDVSDKLALLKSSREIQEQIRMIYELYDFADTKAVKVKLSFNELFTETTSPESTDEEGDEVMARIEDHMDRISL